ncbi:MAG: 4-alpha-glucanotransferase, partial [Gammaproteobacteria bacterium]|nr:4-alpha-glucanotransferase [Gammaproteobacteria bacterium]
WLSDFALFRVLRAQFDEAPWWEWPSALANREITALAKARNTFRDAIEVERFAQFLFFTQWNALRNHASRAGIRLLGDLPIFVAHDSADVWAERKYFKLDRRGQPSVVAGVPPDYFSEDGQLWGNPLYAWRVHADDNFRWWTRRIETQLALYDLFRIDHFRGFAAHWEIPADARTAKGGKWVTGPGEQFFTALREEFGPLPLVAEDLGVITPDVATLLEAVGVPGMKVMQFAFGGGATNPYLPENHVDNCVVYSGTHDNDTTHAWFETLSPSEKQDVAKALHVEPMALPEAVIDAALGSCAKLAMLPLQDVLGLGAGHRMNTPGTVDGNWSWRVRSDQLTPAVCEATRAKLHTHGRILSEAEAAESSPAKQVRAGS